MLKTQLTKIAFIFSMLALACIFAIPETTHANVTKDDGSDEVWNSNIGHFKTKGFAYGENVGFISFYGMTDQGPDSKEYGALGSVESGTFSGYVWGEIIGWTSMQGYTPGGDFYSVKVKGGTNDHSLYLTGFAWNETIGWIDFNNVSINSAGQFYGFAWSDKAGYIHLGLNQNNQSGYGVCMEQGDCSTDVGNTTGTSLLGSQQEDNDGDGYCELGGCTNADPDNYGDCNDTDSSIYPGAPELADGLDNDCNGFVDDGTDSFDDDGDGYTESGGDCNDADRNTHPNATEILDGIDNDCDLTIDEGTIDYDDDADGYCESGSCLNTANTEQDCDDSSSAVGPHATASEGVVDGIDNDCDGSIDEDAGGPAPTDADQDGYADTVDCNDSDASMHPSAVELADEKDNDCDGTVDEGTVNYDDDGDGYNESQGDCNDSNASVNPGVDEIMGDGIDNNCDEYTDRYGLLTEKTFPGFYSWREERVAQLKRFKENRTQHYAAMHSAAMEPLGYEDFKKAPGKLGKLAKFSCKMKINDAYREDLSFITPENKTFDFKWTSDTNGEYKVSVIAENEDEIVLDRGNAVANQEVTSKLNLELPLNNMLGEYRNDVAKWNEFVKTHGIKVVVIGDECRQGRLWNLDPYLETPDIVLIPAPKEIMDPINVMMEFQEGTQLLYKIGEFDKYKLYYKNHIFEIKPGETVFYQVINEDGVKSKVASAHYPNAKGTAEEQLEERHKNKRSLLIPDGKYFRNFISFSELLRTSISGFLD